METGSMGMETVVREKRKNRGILFRAGITMRESFEALGRR